MKKLLIYLAAMAALCGCRDSEAALAAMDSADSLMQTAPDSALTILNGIKPRALHSAEGKARYGLLKSMALDKNFVDTTDFRVLQPAIDYYLNEGTPDQRLRTLYYQGRIYMNQGDEDAAMQSFFKALDLKDEATDQRTVALALIAQGDLYVRQYQPLHYIDNNIEASKIFNLLGDDFSVIECLERVVNGASLTKNIQLADSALLACDSLVKITPEGMCSYLSALIQKTVRFGDNQEIENLISRYKIDDLPIYDAMTLVDGFTKIGECEHALHLMQTLECGESVNDSLRYSAIFKDVYEGLGQYKEAYQWLSTFCVLLDEYDKNIFEQDLLFAEKRHEMEVENIKVTKSRDIAVITSIGTILLISLLSVLLYIVIKLSKAKHILAGKENENLRLEKKQSELEAENLRMKICALEEEQESLKQILAEKKEMPGMLQKVILQRLDALNSLLAGVVANNNAYSKTYDEWVDMVRNNKDKFLASTKLAFSATHPRFTDYIKNFDFTDTEENYIWLCAMGLRGKEIGEYIQVKGYYNLSSSIRRKFGIDSGQANLGIFIRKKMDELDGSVK